MAKGISIHVGVNETKAPGITVEKLEGCVNDATLMHEIARQRDFLGGDPILNENATFERVVGAIEEAATKGNLEKGDFLLFTFSGHGTRLGALLSGDEDDTKDETIVLFDRILIDNVFKFLLWPKFAEGVRIFAVSDSCHSGGAFFLSEGPAELDVSVSKAVYSSSHCLKADGPVEDGVVSNGGGNFREIPRSQAIAHFNLLPDFYNPLRERIAKAAASPSSTIRAKILFLSACEADARTEDGFPLGVFTQALKDVWNDGSFPGNYAEFRKAINDLLPNQTPVLGPKELDAEFVAQKPFTI
jgi:hypothetical protein